VDALHATLLFAAAVGLIRLFTVLFRKGVSPSEILAFLLLIGGFILWD
jgi:hypothetical protein